MTRPLGIRCFTILAIAIFNISCPFVQAQQQRAPQTPHQRASADSFSDEEAKKIVELADRKLFSLKTYPRLRQIFAERFTRIHKDAIAQAWDADMRSWMEQHTAEREILFTAIDQQFDDPQKALQVIAELKNKFPDKILDYWNLAVAVAVTWDQPGFVYGITNHVRQTMSEDPGESTNAIDNFEYFLDNEKILKNYGRYLPWEYLVHVVNHKTPSDQRAWAMSSYAPKRTMFGKCYKDVPYDYVLLNNKGKQSKMKGKPYTLQNLNLHGGVCAQQADFAARVGKSIGVPSEYVTGQNAFGGYHAWVMWVEIKSASKNRISFSLESHGRYRGDKYYVGNLRDPQTGHKITDRQLELRLYTVGDNTTAKRHAELLMDSFEMLAGKKSMSADDKFKFLQEVVDLCPGNELAWQGIAEMVSEPEIKSRGRSKMSRVLSKFFRTFAKMPDFTWTIFDQLVAYEEDPKRKIKLYSQLVKVYQTSKRPDLACKAQIALSRIQVENGKNVDAVEGLAKSILMFADDGRSMPIMLDEVELICEKDKKLGDQLLAFYKKFLPRIPQKRGSRPSKHCIKMYERGIATFNRLGDAAAANFYRAKLNELDSKKQ